MMPKRSCLGSWYTYFKDTRGSFSQREIVAQLIRCLQAKIFMVSPRTYIFYHVGHTLQKLTFLLALYLKGYVMRDSWTCEAIHQKFWPKFNNVSCRTFQLLKTKNCGDSTNMFSENLLKHITFLHCKRLWFKMEDGFYFHFFTQTSSEFNEFNLNSLVIKKLLRISNNVLIMYLR